MIAAKLKFQNVLHMLSHVEIYAQNLIKVFKLEVKMKKNHASSIIWKKINKFKLRIFVRR